MLVSILTRSIKYLGVTDYRSVESIKLSGEGHTMFKQQIY